MKSPFRFPALALAAGIGFACLAAPRAALADDSADCDAGIEMISSEAAKDHPPATSDALKKALRVAKREKGEKEYDECLDAVADAKKALKR